MELEIIVAPELGVAFSHGVGGFQQVITEVTVTGFNHLGMFRFKFTRLVLVPDKAGKLGNRGLRIKPVNVSDFSDDTSGVDLADTRDGSQSVWDDFKLFFNGLIQHLNLFFQSPHRGNRYGHSLVHRVVYGDG